MNANDKRQRVNVSLREPVHFLAFGFGSGLSPVAPGTMGTLATIPLYLLLVQLPLEAYVAALVLAIVAGVWICGESARRLGVHDHSGIVWDEIAGFLLTMLPFAPSLVSVTLGFLAFRLFDVVKPWPIRWLDRQVHGGLGIMVDDLVAALFALALVAAIVHGAPAGVVPGLAFRAF